MQKNLEFMEAARLLAAQVLPVSMEYVPLTASLGRVLGETVRAESDVPPFDRSPFDGYSFRGEDKSECHAGASRFPADYRGDSGGQRGKKARGARNCGENSHRCAHSPGS